MSGTSIDGIDVAAIESDGKKLMRLGPALSLPYRPDLRAAIRQALGNLGADAHLDREITLAHIAAVQRFFEVNGATPADFDVVGFHGHTVAHRPDLGRTKQVGDPQLLAKKLDIDVVGNFRDDDVAAGGQGAPLAPLYHAHLLGHLLEQGPALDWPIAIVNLGGVANVTYIEEGALEEPDRLIAFDTGPGNALIDDWVAKQTGEPYDDNGELAARGTADASIVASLMENSYFDLPPPKSLDRETFATDSVRGLATEDGAATLTSFTAASVGKAVAHLPSQPVRWLLTGGGRHNATLCGELASRLGYVEPIEAVGGRGDSLEAEAFAHLAVRTLRGFPITFPQTTGAPRPLNGGIVYRRS